MELFGGMLFPDAWGLMALPALMVLAALDVFLPLIPSELLVIGGGSFSADGKVPALLVLLAAASGSWLGDLAMFSLFRYRLAGLLERVSWGRRLHRSVLRLGEKAGTSPTYAAIIAARLISGGRTASIAAAGLADIRLRPFMVVSAIGSLVWAIWLVGLGFAMGTATDLPLWESSLMAMAAGLLTGFIAAGATALRHRIHALRENRSGENRHRRTKAPQLTNDVVLSEPRMAPEVPETVETISVPPAPGLPPAVPGLPAA